MASSFLVDMPQPLFLLATTTTISRQRGSQQDEKEHRSSANPPSRPALGQRRASNTGISRGSQQGKVEGGHPVDEPVARIPPTHPLSTRQPRPTAPFRSRRG